MAKARIVKASPDVVRFCQLFYARLDKDDWGAIDPYLFQDIAAEPEEGYLSREDRDNANGMIEVLEDVLREMRATCNATAPIKP